jgi:hypothetical protein
LLWRASGTTQVASFELFVDLLFVGILAINGDHVGEEPNGKEVLRFAITFIMGMFIFVILLCPNSRGEQWAPLPRAATKSRMLPLLYVFITFHLFILRIES